MTPSTASITETPEVGVQVPEWRVTLYLYARQNMLQAWANGCIRYLLSHPTLAESQGFTSSLWGNGCTLYLLTQYWLNLSFTLNQGTVISKQHDQRWT